MIARSRLQNAQERAHKLSSSSELEKILRLLLITGLVIQVPDSVRLMATMVPVTPNQKNQFAAAIVTHTTMSPNLLGLVQEWSTHAPTKMPGIPRIDAQMPGVEFAP